MRFVTSETPFTKKLACDDFRPTVHVNAVPELAPAATAAPKPARLSFGVSRTISVSIECVAMKR